VQQSLALARSTPGGSPGSQCRLIWSMWRRIAFHRLICRASSSGMRRPCSSGSTIGTARSGCARYCCRLPVLNRNRIDYRHKFRCRRLMHHVSGAWNAS
jgi:hypothetical protein